MKESELLQEKFITGINSIEELRRLEQWLMENPDRKAALFRDKDFYQATLLKSDALNRREEEEWNKLKKRITVATFKNPVKNGYALKKVLQTAAIVVVALITGWMGNSLYQYLQIRHANEFDQVVTSGRGQITEVYLPDGTHVWLNAESTLEFPYYFSSAKRIVRLDGEAYFEVHSDLEHPFYVHSDNHRVQVTGTHFNIKKYPEDHKIETVLKEGKVRVLAGNVFKDLLPGQRSSFNTENLEVVIDPVDIDIYTSWHEGRFEFKNESFDKIMKIVERWWDVKVVYDQAKLKGFTFSGVLKKHKEIDYIFDIINELKPIDYQIDNNRIVVKIK